MGPVFGLDAAGVELAVPLQRPELLHRHLAGGPVGEEDVLGAAGHAQFIIATHSPILLACPGATLYSFDRIAITAVPYEDTQHYQIYKSFMQDRREYLNRG